MVWRSLFDITFSDTKQLLVGCRGQLRKKRYRVRLKSIALDEKDEIKKIIVLKCKKMFSFRKLTKISSLIRVGVRQVTFLSENWEKLSVWNNVLFWVSALEMGERKAFIKQTGPNVSVLLNRISALDHDRFMQISHTVSWYLQILKPKT